MYPYTLLNQSTPIGSIFGGQEMGAPYVFDYSDSNPMLLELDMNQQPELQRRAEQSMHQQSSRWGIAGYLEKRRNLLREFPQMVEEERFFHLGVDIFLPVNFALFLPLAGEVIQSGREPGQGNFGGYVLFRHSLQDQVFYSLWGHLQLESLPKVGMYLPAGQHFANIGDYNENGDWFHHTHLQVLTQRGFDEGYISKGYCTQDMLPEIDQLCPSPLFLLRY